MQTILLAATTAATRSPFFAVGHSPVSLAAFCPDASLDSDVPMYVDQWVNGTWQPLRQAGALVSVSRDNPLVQLIGPAVYSVRKPVTGEAQGCTLIRGDELPEDMVHRGLYFGSSPILAVPGAGTADVLVRCGASVLTKARLAMQGTTEAMSLDVFPVTSFTTPGTEVAVNNFWVGNANVAALLCSINPTGVVTGPRITRFMMGAGKQQVVGSAVPMPFVLPAGAVLALRFVNGDANAGEAGLSLNFMELPIPLALPGA